MRSPITTHILDTAMGRPAAEVSVVLSQKKNTGWEELARSTTNADGRVEDLLPAEHSLERAIYRLEFFTLEYFQKNNRESLYPSVSIDFEVKDTTQHYHIPLLLQGFGYATYRGS